VGAEHPSHVQLEALHLQPSHTDGRIDTPPEQLSPSGRERRCRRESDPRHPRSDRHFRHVTRASAGGFPRLAVAVEPTRARSCEIRQSNAAGVPSVRVNAALASPARIESYLRSLRPNACSSRPKRRKISSLLPSLEPSNSRSRRRASRC
jgi:hypothetical protein